MTNDETIYCGSGKSNDERFVNISVCLSDIPKEHVFEYSGKKYVKLTVVKKHEEDKYGKTHFVKINTWKKAEEEDNDGGDEPTNDLPF